MNWRSHEPLELPFVGTCKVYLKEALQNLRFKKHENILVLTKKRVSHICLLHSWSQFLRHILLNFIQKPKKNNYKKQHFKKCRLVSRSPSNSQQITTFWGLGKFWLYFKIHGDLWNLLNLLNILALNSNNTEWTSTIFRILKKHARRN